MADKPNGSLFGRLFGQDSKEAAELEQALRDAQGKLDSAGLERKQYKGRKAKNRITIRQQEKALMEQIAGEIDALLERVTDDPPEGLREQLINVFMSGLLDVGAVAPAEEVVTEEVEDEMMGEGDVEGVVGEAVDGLMADASGSDDTASLIRDTVADVLAELNADDDEERSLRAMSREVRNAARQVKALASDNVSVYDDLKELAPTMVKAFKVVAELEPIIGKLKDLADLSDRVKRIEAAQKAAPRASKAAETQVDPKTNKAAQQAQAQRLDDVPEMFKDAFTSPNGAGE